ncbi:MAG: polysaccharide biosynthesis/export family protein [Hyphomicrobiaceae bacterium]
MSVRILITITIAVFTLTGCASRQAIFGPKRPSHSGEWTTIVYEPGYHEPRDSVVHDASIKDWGDGTFIATEIPRGPQAVADAEGPYLLDSGDQLRIFVYGQPNLSRLYTVGHDGKITVPLIGSIRARARTPRQVQGSIRSLLGREYVRDPHVTVDIQQYRPFFVLGQVQSAGQYPYVSGMTVETAVAIGGGYTERASNRSFRITRRINGVVEQIETASDYVIRPGDTVFVHERFF